MLQGHREQAIDDVGTEHGKFERIIPSLMLDMGPGDTIRDGGPQGIFPRRQVREKERKVRMESGT